MRAAVDLRDVESMTPFVNGAGGRAPVMADGHLGFLLNRLLQVTEDDQRWIAANGQAIGASLIPTITTSPRMAQVTVWPSLKRGVR